MTPLRSRPPVSSAVYSNAPIYPSRTMVMLSRRNRASCRRKWWRGLERVVTRRFFPIHSVFARHAQHFLDRGLALQHLGAPVVADGRCQGTCIALELMLARTIMDHGAELVVDDDELINSR